MPALNASRPSLRAVLAVFVAWVAITLAGSSLLTQGDTPLVTLLTHGPFWPAVAAGLFALAASTRFAGIAPGWQAPVRGTLVSSLWLPVLIVAGIAALAAALGLPSGATAAWVFVNTLAVGFSEELMFRGLLLGALLARGMAPLPAVLASSALFGAVHALNGAVTGAWLESCVQAVAATMSGVLFAAIRVRTGSLWPAIVLHALWDCAVFLAAAGREAPDTAEHPGAAMLMLPVLFVLPNLLWGLHLMRQVGRATPRTATG
jgi:membrane protease YdiL (CAAX protease family)